MNPIMLFAGPILNQPCDLDTPVIELIVTVVVFGIVTAILGVLLAVTHIRKPIAHIGAILGVVIVVAYCWQNGFFQAIMNSQNQRIKDNCAHLPGVEVISEWLIILAVHVFALYIIVRSAQFLKQRR